MIKVGKKANPVCFVTCLVGAAELRFRSLLVCYKIRMLSPWASQVALVVKNPPANAGDIRDTGWIPGPRGSPGGHGNLLQYSCLENPMDREACQATVHRLTNSQTGLK